MGTSFRQIVDEYYKQLSNTESIVEDERKLDHLYRTHGNYTVIEELIEKIESNEEYERQPYPELVEILLLLLKLHHSTLDTLYEAVEQIHRLEEKNGIKLQDRL
jgi:F0F1-type ATP synthase delta subunit